jgi:plastocyanin
MSLRMTLVTLALATGTLAGAAACGKSSSSPAQTPSPTPAPAPSGPTVSIVSGASALTNTAYSPNPITVAVGESVTWVNNDSVTHTTTSNNNVWDATLAPGGRFSRAFMTAGSFPYLCTIHPGMVGTVTVQ